jgi:pyrroloquinoline-quinone synthase
METRSEWSSRLRHFASDAGVLNHPFLLSVRTAGHERKDMIYRWARQDYFTSRDVPCLVGILTSQISDPYARHPLVLNLWEEHGEGDIKKSHFTLYCNMLESIGLRRSVDPDLASKATTEFIECQEAVARQNVLAGLGAFCYANEYLAEKEFDALEAAISFEFPNADVAFFAANREVDGKHTIQTEDVIEALARSSDDLSDVQRGAAIGLQARIAFYDSLLK